jgi:mannose-6-phosphate isomerase
MKSEIRPWGYYEVLVEQPGFKVKRIVVNPYERLSLQSHEDRQEVWTIVSGTGLVTLDGFTLEVKKDDVTIIYPEQKHRIKNTDNKPLVFIEVQTGDYLGEDDIIRYDDDYGRTQKDKK